MIHTENNFVNVDPVLIATNSHVLSEPLTEDQDYYWKVIAVDDRGGETSSATWSFWTNSENSAPAEFTLVSPEQNEETGLTPTFSWNESSDADLYDELVYTLSYGTDPSDLTDGASLSGDPQEKNYSLSFDGEDDFVEVPNFIKEAGTDMTINLYARGTGTMLCPETPQYESYFSF